MLSFLMIAALAIPPDGEPPSMSAPKAVVAGRILVKYREFRIGDTPPQRAPSFSIAPRGGRGTYPLLIKQGHLSTLNRLADSDVSATVVGAFTEVNGHTFLMVESIKESPR